MKISLCSFFFWLSCITICNAQIDSITTQNYKLRELVFTQFINNPSIVQQLPIADFTETGLYASIKKQPFSKTQTPNTISYYGFNSKGIYTLKNNFKLFGNLDFSRSYNKETAYLLLQNIAEEYNNELLPSTNYPLAIRSGENENLHYKLKGGISGKLTEKIPFSVTIDYNLNKYFGINIPKTEQETIDYSSLFQIGYQYKKHTLFTFLSLKRVQNNFSFSATDMNSGSINSISEPDTYAGFSVGYGDILGYNSTLLAGLIENNTQKFGLGYNYTFKNQFITLKYTRKENSEHYYSTEYKDENNLAGLFTRGLHIIDFSYLNNYNNKYLIIDGSFVSGKASNTHAFENYIENFDDLTIKNNYQHLITQGDVSITWQKRKNELTVLGTTFTNKITENSIEDFNTTQKKVSSWHSSININKDIKLTKKSTLNIETGLSYYTPITKILNYSSENSSTSAGNLIPPTSTFGNDVIIHDYKYDTLQKGGSIFNLRYQQQLSKRNIVTINFNYSFLTALQSNSATKNNNNFGLRFNLQY